MARLINPLSAILVHRLKKFYFWNIFGINKFIRKKKLTFFLERSNDQQHIPRTILSLIPYKAELDRLRFIHVHTSQVYQTPNQIICWWDCVNSDYYVRQFIPSNAKCILTSHHDIHRWRQSISLIITICTIYWRLWIFLLHRLLKPFTACFFF